MTLFVISVVMVFHSLISSSFVPIDAGGMGWNTGQDLQSSQGSVLSGTSDKAHGFVEARVSQGGVTTTTPDSCAIFCWGMDQIHGRGT